MKLYRTGTGRWEGTQADAIRAAKADGTTWEAIEVPTDKPSLLTWLNDNYGSTDSPEFLGAHVDDMPSPIAAAHSSIEELQAGFGRNLVIEDQIAVADFPGAIRIASHALCRVQEHINAAAGGAS